MVTVTVFSNTDCFAVVTRHVSLAPFNSVASGVRVSARNFSQLVSSTGSPAPIPTSLHSNLLALRMVVQLITPLNPTIIGVS